MTDVDLAAVGALLGDPSRAAMLDALMGGRALTAGELARLAGIRPPTASAHLSRLTAGGLVVVRPEGRHRYYALAGPQVARVLETLSLIAPARPVRSLRQSSRARSLAVARTCYDHLAGSCGVALHDALVAREWVVPSLDGYAVTTAGERGLTGLGVDVAAARARRRSFARPCLDWTERRSHLAGALAAAVTSRLIEDGWFVRRRDSRGLRVTAAGEAGLADLAS